MKLLTIPILAFSTILMTACISESSSQQVVMNSASTSAANESNTSPMIPDTTIATAETEVATVSETETPLTNETAATPSEEVTPAAQVEILPWLRIPMHYEVLLGQPHIWNETGSIFGLTLAKSALKGSTTLELNSTENLIVHQLISYLSSNGEFYSNQINSIEGNSLILANPLEQNVLEGANAWNFYYNGSHPNSRGYYAVADFAIRLLGKDKLNEGIHVLLGDSWFAEGSISNRLSESLPAATVINKGIGGNTTANILARFDEDVLPYNPNFVWIIAGVNDYWQDVSTATYKANIDSLISKIIAAGGMPIIIDAPVGPLNGSSDAITALSHSYVTAIDQLLAEY